MAGPVAMGSDLIHPKSPTFMGPRLSLGPMSRRLAPIFVLALLLALPAAGSSADVPGQPGIFAQTEPDPSGSAVTIYAECEHPVQPTDTSCTVRLRLEVNGTTVFDKVETIPTGDAGIEEHVDTSKQRDKAYRTTGKLVQVLEFFSADGSVKIGQSKRTDKVGGWLEARKVFKCGFPAAVPAGGGEANVTWGGEHWTMHSGLPAYLSFKVGSQPITAKFHGLEYKFAPGTVAGFDCVGFLTSRGGVLVPTVIIDSGSVE